ncbi:MAG TPA: hypothetical protein VGK24_05560 [Candidatus Angelobacter sp.]
MTALFIAGAIFAFTAAILSLVMHTSINALSPKEQRLAWSNRWNPSITSLCRAYEELFPDNYVTPLARVAYVASIIFGVAILLFRIYR